MEWGNTLHHFRMLDNESRGIPHEVRWQEHTNHGVHAYTSTNSGFFFGELMRVLMGRVVIPSPHSQGQFFKAIPLLLNKNGHQTSSSRSY